jgi:hypothetical protein
MLEGTEDSLGYFINIEVALSRQIKHRRSRLKAHKKGG